MNKKTFSGIMLTLLLTSMLVLAVKIQPVKASGTIYINADGSIDPTTAPMQRNGDLYTLTGDVTTGASGIVVERDNIVVDGGNYLVLGEKASGSRGISLYGSHVTIKHVEITGFDTGVYVPYSSSYENISENTITARVLLEFTRSTIATGIWLEGSNNIISGNFIMANDACGIYLDSSSNNKIYHNNLDNTRQVSASGFSNVWDDGYPSGGNYWSDYRGVDTNGDGIGDTPYVIDGNNIDHYPLINPCSRFGLHYKPLSPGYYDTSEFLIGSVAVGVILPQSNGRIDPNTENWTSADELRAISGITSALNWWAAYNPSAHVSFSMEVHYRVPTSYEPISHGIMESGLWITDTIRSLGYSSVLDYVNDLRNRMGTDWAFLIFVADGSLSSTGRFADGRIGTSPVGGPYSVVGWAGWQDTLFETIVAHEMGIVFYATDEYGPPDNWPSEYTGYLNVSSQLGADCIMGADVWRVCNATQGQIGWWDSNGNGILDIIDTYPDITLNSWTPVQAANGTLTCSGFITEVPYPNRNPYTLGWDNTPFCFFPIPRTGRNITINTITRVEYRVDYGSWANATPTDGALDEAQENSTFNIPMLPSGTHIVEVRGTNSVGNSKIVNMTYELSASTLNRNYDVIVKDTHGNIVPDVNLTLKSTDNMVLWNSSTDIQGKADFNLTFTDSNYTDVLGLEAVKGNLSATASISFLSDTPVTLSLGSHDIATSDVALSKTVVGQGLALPVNVTVMNEGDFAENFNVTVYANTTALGTQSVFDLSNGTSATLTFIWNTTGFDYGNYTISAYAWPVPGETDTTDNNFTGGSVVVSMVGDLTGGSTNVWDFVPDGKVDGKDIAVAAKCFGSAPGSQPPEIWKPNCDVNNDGKCDGKDIAIVARHFGESDP